MNEQLNQIAKLKAEYEAAVKAVGREGIQKLLAPVFESFPNVKAVRWTQYTPYFNDGEPCEFSSNADYPELCFSADPAGDVVTKEDFDEDFEGSWGCRQDAEKQKAFKAFKEALALPDDVLLAAFGDHAQVTVDRNGVEVEEYSHD
jgi:hypothetical protein